MPFGPWDTLARTRTKILINGEQLDADPDTFSVVRWMPDARDFGGSDGAKG